MNKRVRAKLAVFQRIQQGKPQYHFPRSSPHEQAIAGHIRLGYGDGLTRVAGLLSQSNRIDALNELSAYDQDLKI